MEWGINTVRVVSEAITKYYKNVHTCSNVLNLFRKELAEMGVSKEVLEASRMRDVTHQHYKKQCEKASKEKEIRDVLSVANSDNLIDYNNVCLGIALDYPALE